MWAFLFKAASTELNHYYWQAGYNHHINLTSALIAGHYFDHHKTLKKTC
jgi:hypothetical protein